MPRHERGSVLEVGGNTRAEDDMLADREGIAPSVKACPADERSYCWAMPSGTAAMTPLLAGYAFQFS